MNGYTDPGDNRLSSFGRQQVDRLGRERAERVDRQAGRWATPRYYCWLLTGLVMHGVLLAIVVGLAASAVLLTAHYLPLLLAYAGAFAVLRVLVWWLEPEVLP